MASDKFLNTLPKSFLQERSALQPCREQEQVRDGTVSMEQPRDTSSDKLR